MLIGKQEIFGVSKKTFRRGWGDFWRPFAGA
jgi:hypothetical protein